MKYEGLNGFYQGFNLVLLYYIKKIRKKRRCQFQSHHRHHFCVGLHALRLETCAYIPGCSTFKGETAYGGWCSGDQCAHLDEENCLLKSKCHWKSVKSEGPESLCRGDLGRWQNPGCSFSNDREACMWMPGCNWAGQNHFGGWCTGDQPHCAMETSNFACQDAQCHWQSSKL